MLEYLVGKKGSSYQRILVSSNINLPPSLVIVFLRFTPVPGCLTKDDIS